MRRRVLCEDCDAAREDRPHGEAGHGFLECSAWTGDSSERKGVPRPPYKLCSLFFLPKRTAPIVFTSLPASFSRGQRRGKLRTGRPRRRRPRRRPPRPPPPPPPSRHASPYPRGRPAQSRTTTGAAGPAGASRCRCTHTYMSKTRWMRPGSALAQPAGPSEAPASARSCSRPGCSSQASVRLGQ